jgi:hypothetical protein
VDEELRIECVKQRWMTGKITEIRRSRMVQTTVKVLVLTWIKKSLDNFEQSYVLTLCGFQKNHRDCCIRNRLKLEARQKGQDQLECYYNNQGEG